MGNTLLKLVLLNLGYISVMASNVDCTKHKIYCQIIRNKEKVREKIEHSYAMRLSNAIYKVSRELSLDGRIYAAILMQESRYVLDSKNCHTGLNEQMKPLRVCSDFSLSMINHRTADRYGIDIARLMHDLDYSVYSGARILSDFKKRFKNEEDYYVRYNCGSARSTKRDTCVIYKKLVDRFLE
jgi:hypothetical protein